MPALVQRLREFAAARLAVNFTTTVVGATSTLLTFNVLPNEVWIVDAQLTTQCSGTGGMKYAVAAPALSTIEGWVKSSGAAILTLIYQRLVAIATLTATAMHTVATTPGPDTLRFTITAGANGGPVAIQAASVTAGQTTTIFAGSWISARRVL